ncbi:MAG: carboxypeptidase-like regulatory domain-containing protein [Bryobacteraceae bacterium]
MRLVTGGRFALLLLLGGVSAGLAAQETPQQLPLRNFALQIASAPAAQTPVPATPQSQSLASIGGIVRDTSGTAVSGVEVALRGKSNTVKRTVATDSNGAFAFLKLSAGTYLVQVQAAGLKPSAPADVTLTAGEKRQLKLEVGRIPVQTTTVQVRATPEQVAQAQVKEEEQQRVLGVFPNYYTSYIWNAAPMTPKQKFDLALHTTTSPVTFLVTAGVAGVEQAHNTFPGYGQGLQGYGKRYGAAYADTITKTMLGRALLPAILHQDPRYFYQGSGTFWPRVFHALLSTVVCRGDDGRLEPNYSYIAGSFAAAGLSNFYRAPQDRQVGLTFRNGLVILGSGAATNVLREFFSKKLTHNVPKFANGKP